MGTRHLQRTGTLISFIAFAACASGSDPAMEGPASMPASPTAPTPPTPPPSATLSVLFIGNSLTYYNDLPRTLSGIARSAGDLIHTDMVAGPKLTLMDQFGEGSEAEAAIVRGGWDFVVLQQGPSSDSASRAMLVNVVQQFDVLIRSAGAQTALYMVWPSADHPGDFCATGAAYAAAAAAVDGLLLPAGVAWEYALQQSPAPKLYDPDGGHPAPLGTYLAAITIYEKLTGHDARELPSRAVVNGVVLDEPTTAVSQLQEAAHVAASYGAGTACASKEQ